MIQNIGKTFILWLAIVIAVAIGSIIWVQNSLLFFPNTSIFNWSPDDEAQEEEQIVREQRQIQEIQTQINQAAVPVFNSSTHTTQPTQPTQTTTQPTNQPTHNQPSQTSHLDLEIERVEREIRELQTRLPEINQSKEVMIPDDKGGIAAYFIENFPGKDFLVYCHGTSGNIADRKYVYDMAQTQELNLLLFDYHGYGKSPRYPSVEGILRDGLTAVDFLINTKKISPGRIIVWGESLGGSVAAHIARLRKIKGVVLMATFSSMHSLIMNMETLGWIRFPLSMISKVTLHPLNTSRWITQTKIPVVVMHSRKDDYIKFDCGYENFTYAKEPKKFIEIRGTHIKPDITYDEVCEALKFIEENKITV